MSSRRRPVRALFLRWVLCASIPTLVLCGTHKHYISENCRLYSTLPVYSGCDVNECRIDSEALETKGELETLDDGENICHMAVEADTTTVSIVVPTTVVPAAGKTCADAAIEYSCKKVGGDNSEAMITAGSQYRYGVQSISAMSCLLENLKIDDRYRDSCGIELIILKMGKQYLGRYECSWQPADASEPPLKFYYKLDLAEFSCSNCFGRDKACKTISLPKATGTSPTSKTVPLDDLMKPMEVQEHYVVKVGQPFCFSLLGVSDKPYAKGGSFYFSNGFTDYHERALQRPLGNHTFGSRKVNLLKGVSVFGGFHNCLWIASMTPELAGVYQYYYITDAGKQLAVTIKISVAAPGDMKLYVEALTGGIGLLLLMVIALAIFIFRITRDKKPDPEERKSLVDHVDETPLDTGSASVDTRSTSLRGSGRHSPFDTGQNTLPHDRWLARIPSWWPFRTKRGSRSSSAASTSPDSAARDADRSSSDSVSPRPPNGYGTCSPPHADVPV